VFSGASTTSWNPYQCTWRINPAGTVAPLQIQLHRSSKGVDFYTLVLDGQKCERRLAVKRMAWEVINEKIADPAITEVGKLVACP